MNLRVNEGVRCAFDKEESVLRFTLKELIEGQKGDSEVVVYAFKVLLSLTHFRQNTHCVVHSRGRRRQSKTLCRLGRDW